jgi:hypothetical protein
MVIWFTKTLFVRCNDGLNWEACRLRTTDREGKPLKEPKEKLLGYYGKLDQAARGCLNYALASEDIEASVAEVVSAIETASDKIATACEGACTAAQTQYIAVAYNPEELLEGM